MTLFILISMFGKNKKNDYVLIVNKNIIIFTNKEI